MSAELELDCIVSGDGNSNSPCVTENLTCYDLAEISTTILAVHATFLVILTVLSLLANGLVLLLVAKYKRLRNNRSVLLTLVIVAADLLLTFTYSLPSLVTTIFRRWVFGTRGCMAFGFVASDILFTRWLIISIFCIDRFCNVKFPFRYRKHGKWILVALIPSAWITPLILSAIPLPIFAEFELRLNIPTCLPGCHDNEQFVNLCKIYYGIITAVSFIMGSIVPISIYSWLYTKGKNMRRSVRNSIGQITVQVAGGVIRRPFTDYRAITDTEKRATVTFMLVFITVLVTALPTFLSQLVRAISFRLHCNLPLYIHFVIFQILLSAFVLNPIFIMRDADFRHCIVDLFCCGRRTGDTTFINSYNWDQNHRHATECNHNHLGNCPEIQEMQNDQLERTMERIHEVQNDQLERTMEIINATYTITGLSETVSHSSV